MTAISTFLAGLTGTPRGVDAPAAKRPGASWRRATEAAVTAPRPVVPAVKVAASPYELDGIVHVLTCGSVDDGKSTLIGRLLWEAGDVPEDTRAGLIREAEAAGTPDDIDYSRLLDGLLAEREQGITIDIAWRSFDATSPDGGGRRFVVIDSPGHEQYTRNMASGASHADVAVMLVDARTGIKPQTRRHAAILDLVGVAHVVLAVNKMDLAGWDETRFRAIAAGFEALCAGFSFRSTVAIPVSARRGDQIATSGRNMAWYAGPTLLQHLHAVPGRATRTETAFRLPVQSVLRGDRDFRGIAGRVTSGRVRAGDVVREAVTGQEARVARIVTMDGDLETAEAGRSVVLELDRDIDVGRGSILALPEAPPTVTRQIEARLVWLGDADLASSNGLLLRTATDLVPVANIEVGASLDLGTMAARPADNFRANDIGTARIALSRSVALDVFRDIPATGGFVLVDALTGATVAGGTVTAATRQAPMQAGKSFKLTYALLAQTVCSDLPKGKRADAEFRRRASEVAFLLSAAGAEVDMEEFENGGGI